MLKMNRAINFIKELWENDSFCWLYHVSAQIVIFQYRDQICFSMH